MDDSTVERGKPKIGDIVTGCQMKMSGSRISMSVKEGELLSVTGRWATIKVRGKAMMVEADTIRPIKSKNALTEAFSTKC